MTTVEIRRDDVQKLVSQGAQLVEVLSRSDLERRLADVRAHAVSS